MKVDSPSFAFEACLNYVDTYFTVVANNQMVDVTLNF